MQIKASSQLYLTQVKMAKIDKITYNKSWSGCREKETLIHGWVEIQADQTILEISLENPQEIKSKTTILSNYKSFWHILKGQNIPINGYFLSYVL